MKTIKSYRRLSILYTATLHSTDDPLCKAQTASISFTYDATPLPDPTMDPVTTPTSYAAQTLTGGIAAGASVRINGTEAIPVGPETTWSHQIALQEGDNPLESYSEELAGNRSGSVFSNIFFDETALLPVYTVVADGDSFVDRLRSDKIVLARRLLGLSTRTKNARHSRQRRTVSNDMSLAQNGRLAGMLCRRPPSGAQAGLTQTPFRQPAPRRVHSKRHSPSLQKISG